jgi:hypothetical protein
MKLISEAETNNSVKTAWEFDLPHRPKDNGLIRQSKGETDNKWIFQFHPFLKKQLKERGVNTSNFTDFLLNVESLYYLCRAAARNALSSMDATMPGYDFLARLDRKPDTEQHMLRIAVYDPGYNVLAHSHTDRGPITIHVAESEPGLELIEEEILYRAKPDTGLVFYGLQAKELTNGILAPTLHQAINKTDSGEKRWSIVFFTSIDVGVPYHILSEKVDAYDKITQEQRS